jgi:hypothetical protein
MEARRCTREQKLVLVAELRKKAFFRKGRSANNMDAITLARLMNTIAAEDVGFRRGLRYNQLPRVHISGVSFSSTPSAKPGEEPIETLAITFRDEQSGDNLPGTPLLIRSADLMNMCS